MRSDARQRLPAFCFCRLILDIIVEEEEEEEDGSSVEKTDGSGNAWNRHEQPTIFGP